ncbi:glycosyltransferase family 39 protein [Streptomyces sp. NPDC059909]|uniref:glycosyltransferase family 39 protein n=1 Tax=Streptomyces sp. NPDC059909 TaxID=3346998 RepID=UPI003647A40A
MATLSPPAQRSDEAQPAGPQQQPVRRQTGLWLWPALLALPLMMYKINTPVLGTDELATWEVARRSTGQILVTLQHVDAVHGTYYLFMHAWMEVFGDSPTALRAPSALAMTVAAAVVALTGRRLFGAPAGLCGGLVFALIPAVSRFGQETRGYALVMLATALATLLLLRALEKPRSWWRWGAYALCLTCAGLLHLISLSIVLAHTVAVVVHAWRERRALWSFGLAAVVGTACVSPVIVLGLSHDGRQLFWVEEPDGWSLLRIPQEVFASGVCAGALIALAVLAVPVRKERRDALVLCIAVAVLPLLTIWAASHGEVSYFRYQYALFTLPAWSVLAGAGLAATTRSWGATAAAVTVLGLLVVPDQTRMREQYEHDVPHRVDYPAAARTIAKYHRPGDTVVYGRGQSWMIGTGIHYYLPRDLTLRQALVARTAVEVNDLFAVDCPQPTTCLGADKRRIWVVAEDGNADPLRALPFGQAMALRAKYTAFGAERHTGVTVELLVRKPR